MEVALTAAGLGSWPSTASPSIRTNTTSIDIPGASRAPTQVLYRGTCTRVLESTVLHNLRLWDVLLAVPVTLFMAFLCATCARAQRKMREEPQLVHKVYYGLVWALTTAQTLRTILIIAGTFFEHPVILWKVLWIISLFGLTFVELSVLVFMFWGRRRQAKGLVYALKASGGITLIVALLHVGALIFVEFYPPFGGDKGTAHWSDFTGIARDTNTEAAAIYWLSNEFIFTALYIAVPVMHYCLSGQGTVGGKGFYRYVGVMLVIHLSSVVGFAILIAQDDDSDGTTCLLMVSSFLYWGFYGPIFYATFLYRYIQSPMLSLDFMTYSQTDSMYTRDEISISSNQHVTRSRLPSHNSEDGILIPSDLSQMSGLSEHLLARQVQGSGFPPHLGYGSVQRGGGKGNGTRAEE